MGNLMTLHKDILRNLFRSHLDKSDRILLLWAVNIKTPITQEFNWHVTEKGYLNVLKWAVNIYYDINDHLCAIAAEKGHVEILKWLYDDFIECHWYSSSLSIRAADNGHLEVLKLIKSFGCYIDPKICAIATVNGHTEILEWANTISRNEV